MSDDNDLVREGLLLLQNTLIGIFSYGKGKTFPINIDFDAVALS
ncbi:hypothetical protein EZS27_020154 [termite gut metagenome]|uniref:Uncharacterized protein n=1 Tax=termite gut metagenome TaxID=433724 RepID=A0A5J4RBM5_9ZZZZ